MSKTNEAIAKVIAETKDVVAEAKKAAAGVPAAVTFTANDKINIPSWSSFVLALLSFVGVIVLGIVILF